MKKKGKIMVLAKYSDGTPSKLSWLGPKKHIKSSAIDCYASLGGIDTVTKYSMEYFHYPNKKQLRGKKEVEVIFTVLRKI